MILMTEALLTGILIVLFVICAGLAQIANYLEDIRDVLEERKDERC